MDWDATAVNGVKLRVRMIAARYPNPRRMGIAAPRNRTAAIGLMEWRGVK